MTSGNDAPEAIDVSLAEARDSVLQENERIIAQEEGDPGQAIVLTETRLLAIKVGIAVTGEADGRLIGDFPLGEITAVNVRKGPLGAVIQIVTGEKQTTTPGVTPNNVVVFTGPERVSKCEAMAAAIEPVLGKSLGRVEAQPVEVEAAADTEVGKTEETTAAVSEVPVEKPADKPSRVGREPRTLADEMFAELSERENAAEATQEPVPSPPVQDTATAPEVPPPMVVEEETVPEEELEEEIGELKPNPNLPKPVQRGRGPMGRVLVLMGLLMAAILVCVSITGPLRNPPKTPSIDIDVSTLTNSPTALRKQQAALAQYESEVVKTLAPCRKAVAAFTTAVRSGDAQATRAALCEGITDECWQKLSKLEEPAGLTTAKESIVSGVMTVKTAVMGVSGSLQSSAPIDAARVVGSLQDGQNRIDKGLTLIRQMRAGLKTQQARMESGADKKQ